MKLVGMVVVASVMVVMQTGVCDAHSRAQVPSRQASFQKIQTSVYVQQVASLSRCIHFLKDVYCCTTTDLSSWFAGQARATDRKLVQILRMSVDDRLDTTVTDDLHTAVALLEKTINHERVIFNPEERGYIKVIITKHKKVIQEPKRALSLLSVANWLWKQAAKIFARESELKQSLKTFLQIFPAKELAGHISSPTLKKLFISFGDTGTLDDFFAAWDAVDAFFNNNQQQFLSVFAADIAAQPDPNNTLGEILKDFAGLTTVLINYTYQYFVHETLEQKALTLEQLLDLYNKISSLPIVDAIVALSALVKQFSSIIDALRQQDGNLDLGQWLKENWVVFPLVIGVIVIKIAQYYYQQDGSTSTATI